MGRSRDRQAGEILPRKDPPPKLTITGTNYEPTHGSKIKCCEVCNLRFANRTRPPRKSSNPRRQHHRLPGAQSPPHAEQMRYHSSRGTWMSSPPGWAAGDRPPLDTGSVLTPVVWRMRGMRSAEQYSGSGPVSELRACPVALNPRERWLVQPPPGSVWSDVRWQPG